MITLINRTFPSLHSLTASSRVAARSSLGMHCLGDTCFSPSCVALQGLTRTVKTQGQQISALAGKMLVPNVLFLQTYAWSNKLLLFPCTWFSCLLGLWRSARAFTAQPYGPRETGKKHDCNLRALVQPTVMIIPYNHTYCSERTIFRKPCRNNSERKVWICFVVSIDFRDKLV